MITSDEDSEQRSLERTLAMVRGLIEKIEAQLASDTKGTLAEYIKLLQIQKELEDKQIRKIEVKWVED